MISSSWSSILLISASRSILVWSPRYVRPSLADLLRPSMRTLKHIVVDIDVDLDVDPLFGISSELEDIHTKNVIETVAIGIRIEADVIYGRDHWSRLDKVLTTPGWFSLQRVSVAIEATTFSWSEEFDELKMAWQKLPETQFPRLSSSNSISNLPSYHICEGGLFCAIRNPIQMCFTNMR